MGAGGGGIDPGQCQHTIQKAHDAFNYALQSKDSPLRKFKTNFAPHL
jgi:hypothetical protein